VKADGEFQHNWSTVSEWNEASRYRPEIGEAQARQLYVAITQE